MTDVRLVKDCGLYPSYKKIIDFTGTKSEIITKQLAWIDSFNPTTIFYANYNKFQNKLVLEMDYEEALTYTYAVMTDITKTGVKPMFFFIDEVENLSNGIDDTNPNVAINFSLDPIMTYMGDFNFSECMVNREHCDRWENGHIKRITPISEGVDAFNITTQIHNLQEEFPNEGIAICVITFTSPYIRYDFTTEAGPNPQEYERTKEFENAIYQGVFLVDLNNVDNKLKTKIDFSITYNSPVYTSTFTKTEMYFPSLKEIINGEFQSNLPVTDESIVSFTLSPITLVELDIDGDYYNLKDYIPK